jgi:cold shock CspA family protein
MYSETVVWYNPGNRFALIKPDNGREPFLTQLTEEEAMHTPLAAGQRFVIHSADCEASATP